MIGNPQVDGPEVAINRQPALVLRPPLAGDGWLVTSGCCKPNVHRDERIAINGARIETAETFAVDWGKVKGDRLYEGDGKKVEQFYGFGEDVLAVADGTVVSTHDGMSDATPFVAMTPKSKSDYGGNNSFTASGSMLANGSSRRRRGGLGDEGSGDFEAAPLSA